MKELVHRIAQLALAIILSSCGNTSQQTDAGSHTDTVKETKTGESNSAEQVKKISTEKTGNLNEYYYDPSVSIVTGTITSETFYGAPGFGETPQQDEKEKILILRLDQPITVIAPEGSDEFNITRNGITEIQLSSPDINLAPFEHKKVKLTGMFFGAHTGHHYTDVLMTVQKAGE